MLVPRSPYRITLPIKPRQKVLVLGSTGSIGVSTLAVLSQAGSRFEVWGLVAKSNADKLAQQVHHYKPSYAALSDSKYAQELRQKVPAGSSVKVLSGDDEICALACHPEVDVVVAAIVGVSGLKPVLSALKAGKRVALANKESLVVAGELVKKLQLESGAIILPVDSEHSAIYQTLQGVPEGDLENIILTASGGPFLDFPIEEMKSITPEQAVKHPRWNMGAKISVDSATLMNKALEVIEAHWLFGLESKAIQVIIHPQSIVHSMIALRDGSVLAQLSVPDMRGPIAYALSFPESRISGVMPKLDFCSIGMFEFRELDNQRFPAVQLARECIKSGGAMSAIMNCANEAVVEAFLRKRITFDRIVPTVEKVLSKFGFRGYSSYEDLVNIDLETREETYRLVSE